MKKSTLALSALTLVLAAGLSACGGGTSTYTIGGVVSGLEYDGLVLTNNGEELTLKANGYTPVMGENGVVTGRTPNDVTYSFRNQVDYGDPYDVQVKTPPPHQTCDLGRGNADIAGRLSVIDVRIFCTLVSNEISGSIEGLTAEGLELTNGSTGGRIVVEKGATRFKFELPVTYKQTYGVTVLTQPTGQTCTVSNGAGEMGDNAVENIAVVCRSNI